MELDNRAINFIQNAKAQGYSKEEVAKFLQDKGYDIGEQPQDKYSALDKAKYMGRAGAEGLTFGLGDIVAGATNVFANDLADITHGKDLKTRLKGLGRSYYRALNPASIISDDNFKQGRKEFVNEQEQFAQAHPWLNLGGELAGGLVTGVGSAAKGGVKALAKPTIGAMIKGGAKEGAKFGALYGLGSGFTEDADRLSVANALKGAGVGTLSGAVLGGALPVGIAGVVAGGKYLGKPLVTGGKKVADYFRNKTINTLTGANKGLVEQSIKEGKPLIDIADQKLMDVAEGANLINREAKQTFADYGKARIEGQHPKLVETLGEYFDKKGSHQLQDELRAQTLKTSEPLYNKANYVTDKKGNIVLDAKGQPIGKLIPEFETLQGEDADVFMKYIRQGYADEEFGRKIKGLPQNDMRVLDTAKKMMDKRIAKLERQGAVENVAEVQRIKNKFLETIDKANPEYKAARANYERGMKAKSALEQGKAAMSEGERENLSYDYNKLNPEEKFYFRKGVGNALEKASNQKAEGGNVYHKVFDAETRRRLKTLDIPNYDKLEKFALDEMKAASNITSLRGGSPTADRLEAIKRFALGVIRRPTRTVTNVLANTAFKPFYANPAEVAKAMTDPVFLAKLYAQAEKNGGKGAGKSVIEALNQIGRMAGGTAEEAQSNLNIRQILNDATKPIKNKGGYIGEKPKINDVLNKGIITKKEAEFIARQPEEKQNAIIDAFAKKKEAEDFAKIAQEERVTKERLAKEAIAKEKETQMLSDYANAKEKDMAQAANETLEEYLNRKGIKARRGANYELHKYDWEQAQAKATNLNKPAIKQILNSEGKPVATTEQGTKNFQKWFGDSKVVDKENKPLVVYHGGAKFNTFENTGDGSYYFTNNKKWAADYARGYMDDLGRTGQGELKEVYLSLKNPAPPEKTANFSPYELAREGYDGSIFTTPEGDIVYRVYNPNQIKSVKNKGTFDKKNPNIYKALIGGVGISQILKNKEAK